MPQSAAQVRILPAGDVSIGPTTATAPTDAETPLDADFLKYGYIDEAGPGFTPGLTTFNIPAWQGIFPVVIGVSERSEEINFTLLQMTEEALSLAHGGGTWSGASGSRSYSAPTDLVLDPRSMVLDATDGTDSIRFYWPRVQITSVGRISFTKTGAATLPLTFQVSVVDADTPPLQIFDTFSTLSLSDVT